MVGPLIHHRRGVPCFVRERSRGGKSKGNKGDDPRILTSKLKKAETVAALLGVLDGAVDSLNHIHASAACTSLAAFNQKGQLRAVDAKSPVIQRLASRIEELIAANEVGPRELANIFWAFAKMFPTAPVVLTAVPTLARAVALRANGMKAQELANSLWAAVRLYDERERPEALEAVPALVAYIPSRAGKMDAQGLANSLWAAAQLQDALPSVLNIVPAIVSNIPGKAGLMIPQGLSNSLWAAARLQDADKDVREIVPTILGEFASQMDKMLPQDLANNLEAMVYLDNSLPGLQPARVVSMSVVRLKRILRGLTGKDLLYAVPMVVWACASLEVEDAELLAAVADRFASPRTVASVTDLNLCAMAWSYRTLDKAADFTGLLDRLEAEISKKGLREADVLAERRRSF